MCNFLLKQVMNVEIKFGRNSIVCLSWWCVVTTANNPYLPFNGVFAI